MPYAIYQVSPRGYVVMSNNGTVLSKKPMSLAVAKSQLTAVNIREFGKNKQPKKVH